MEFDFYPLKKNVKEKNLDHSFNKSIDSITLAVDLGFFLPDGGKK